MYDKLKEVLLYICSKDKIGKTRLVKLIYLADLKYCELFGRTITSAKYIKYHYGPYSFDIERSIKYLKDMGHISISKRETKKGTLVNLIETKKGSQFTKLSRREKMVLNNIMRTWLNKPTDEIVEETKNTIPYIRAEHISEPIQFKNVRLKRLLNKHLDEQEELLLMLSSK